MRIDVALGRLIFAGLLLLDSSCCSACPFCQSETGRQVSAGVFNNFWSNALVTFAPFPILLLVVALIQFELPRRHGRRRDE
jgi:hypothetical protein